jgi:hypothetical protein
MRNLLIIIFFLFVTNLSGETIYTAGYNSVNNSGGGWVETLITVDISLHTAITIDVDYGETGVLEKLDQFQIHYRVDAGVWNKPVKIKNDMASDASFSVAGLEGASLEILFRMDNDDAGEVWWYDNLIVTGTPISLPVELLYFTAKSDDTIIVFSWATGSEVNNDYFELQESVDGIEYNTIEYINGSGNSPTLIEYSITSHIENTNKYYRLTQVDFDGTISYSNIIAIPRKEISNTVVGIFDITGRPVSMDYRGVIIIKYSDGSTTKIITK